VTVRVRILVVTLASLVLAMSVWGWIQLRVLENILFEQQIKRLYDVAETVHTYYQHFPTRQGLSALDVTLKDLIQADIRFARIDIFTVDKNRKDADYVAGASRLQYEWPEVAILSSLEQSVPKYTELTTDSGPALGLLYPFTSDREGPIVVGVISFSQSRGEILSRARMMLVYSTAGLLVGILLVLVFIYGWIIDRPLKIIVEAIDEFPRGLYKKRISVHWKDEWGYVAEHFNSMADEIQRVHGENQELTRHLEQRVQEATSKVVQLTKQVNQLQQLTALGYLTATLAHDLGTPLHSIAGMAQLLLERADWPPDVHRKLELIVQQTQRLNLVIKNIRRATRLPEPHMEALSIQNLFGETSALVEPLIQNTGVSLTVRIEEGVPGLYVDRHRTQTALFNLIQNALEVMPEGGGIVLSAYPVPEKNAVAMSVRDEGPGIPRELQEKVFEPFFSTHADEGLRGLGLAIVQDIVKMHGGEIELKSRPGEGTEFILYFPIVEKPSA
jgi:signal transduction histidine kinase